MVTKKDLSKKEIDNLETRLNQYSKSKLKNLPKRFDKHNIDKKYALEDSIGAYLLNKNKKSLILIKEAIKYDIDSVKTMYRLIVDKTKESKIKYELKEEKLLSILDDFKFALYVKKWDYKNDNVSPALKEYIDGYITRYGGKPKESNTSNSSLYKK